jgi:hypothetical protein
VPRGAEWCRTHEPKQFWFARHAAPFSTHDAATVRKTTVRKTIVRRRAVLHHTGTAWRRTDVLAASANEIGNCRFRLPNAM